MNRRRALLALTALVVGAGAACTKDDQPEDPAWGKQPCAHCAMLVSDKRFASQLVEGGERRYFDDVGCMVLWMEERKATGARAWVRQGDAWVSARSARFEPGARTPMDFGFEAKGDGPRGWDEVREQVLARKRGGS